MTLVFLARETFPAELPVRTDLRRPSGHTEAALARSGDRWIVFEKPGFMPSPVHYTCDSFHDALGHFEKARARVRQAAVTVSRPLTERERLEAQLAQVQAQLAAL